MSSQSTDYQRTHLSFRMLLATLAGILTLFSAGCYGPARGPTNPKNFIVEGRQWTNTQSVPDNLPPPPDNSARSSNNPAPVESGEPKPQL